nr:MAG TPA: hypothetical protein [Caudoviricetes sp.]
MAHTISYYLGNRNDFIPLIPLYKAVCTPKQLYFCPFPILPPSLPLPKL